jgi:death-on-curing protein
VTEPIWLSTELILAVHERLIAEFGGLAGLRDEGLLNSALGKPRNLFVYSSPTLFDLAASYAFGIAKNHPFFDGNKRTSFAAAAVFLETNCHQFTAQEIDATAATLALAEGKLSEQRYAAWLAEHSRSETRPAKEKPVKHRVKKAKR